MREGSCNGQPTTMFVVGRNMACTNLRVPTTNTKHAWLGTRPGTNNGSGNAIMLGISDSFFPRLFPSFNVFFCAGKI